MRGLVRLLPFGCLGRRGGSLLVVKKRKAGPDALSGDGFGSTPGCLNCPLSLSFFGAGRGLLLAFDCPGPRGVLLAGDEKKKCRCRCRGWLPWSGSWRG
jgi:hypothetical protein